MTCIKESLIKHSGDGVFATKSYKKGDYVCFYDAYEGDNDTIEKFVYSIVSPFDHKSYIGYKDIRNPDGVGQIINDYCMFTLENEDRDENGLFKLSSEKINKKIDEYNHLSLKHVNVAYSSKKENYFKMHAIKDIKENEELYNHYGVGYWISKIQLTTKEPFTRLYCLLKNNVLRVINDNVYIYNEIIDVGVFLQNYLGILPDGNFVKILQIENLSNIEKLKYLINKIQ